MAIKNIIFDLGGVIIDIYPERSLKAFAQHISGLGEKNIYHHRLFHELETGAIAPAAFRDKLRESLNVGISDTLIDDCMIAMLGRIPPGRIEVLEKMKQGYQTLLLSNTNAIHYDAISRYLSGIHGVSLEQYFFRTYYSHLVGLKKPDVRIFELVLRENNLVPEETLFLDDTGEHLENAQSLGIITVKVTPENDIRKILKDF